jgi:uncharacterized protein with HEPN domain
VFSDRDIQRLEDIIENADAICSYIRGMTFEAFERDRKTMDATERCIERVIEATIQIGPAKIAQVLHTFPAAEVRGMGNRLRHEYGTINRLMVWNTAEGDIPPLREACAQMLAQLRNG